ncbi:DUF805 domain-containing protein [Listeria sp. FSL L7-0233]|uniref:DUF805 domain-containing protein n=1 Tax=Listeria cossartiae TaxID=2838249 RepID=UPI0016249CC4|nr:DUF805 domain-containing protein [Listeria cossartiae]MBC1567816.1 DUF805 domain-containing protein [Listeria cossartiae subsp. cossartiae]MBC2182734.1 DUF805 domain-containing protein [Listeria cossartiae subsp. cossartiae]MBC2185132.1 DUF805 domain-containing protein [Listeria cossartiae subsp. cossartiae]MBC2191059.1 DUF805 domain-containing protein [Listeria cossartiae subsp. cossartiae]MCD2224024.1 DUF805 domain-containing protein [Listeria cossartiae]
MGFLEAYKSFWKNYVNFNGRAPGSAYWYVWVWNVIIIGGLYLLAGIFGMSMMVEGGSLAGGGMAIFILIVMGLYSLAALLPTLSLIVRRLHDTGKSGFFIFLGLIPFVGSLIIIIFMCLSSDGPNQYGEGL